MTKQQHLSWSPIPTITTTTTTTTATTNTSSASTNNKNNQYHKNEFYIPLYRSMTDEESYADKPSPITRFVTKLLGLGTSSSNTPSNNNTNTNNKHHKQRRRPPLAHKSHSTTSITKNNSVISTPSSLQNNNNNNDTTTSNSHFNEQQQQEQEEKEKEVKESSIRVSIIEWNNDKENEDENDNDSISSTLSLLSNDTMNSSICSETCTGKKRTRKKKKDLTNNHSFTTLSSSLLYNNTTSCNCNCNNNNTTTTTTTSAAVDALVSAATQIKQYEEEKRKKQQNLIGFLDNMDPPQLINRKEDTEPVLNEIISEKLRSYLPRRHRLAMKWSLLYSLDQHGASLTTLYRQCRPYRGPCILAIKDADDSIFGAFLNEPFKSNNASYYGTGECFLWKYCAKSGNIQVFPWTGKNEYMILSETEFIAIGGGDGKFGLWINSDLEHGHSEPCPTFDNECLSRKPEFACMELEIFTIPCG